MSMPKPTISREEFLARFKAEMIRLAPFRRFDPDPDDGSEGELVADYAERVAPSYWEDGYGCKEDPEECAAADISYWGD